MSENYSVRELHYGGTSPPPPSERKFVNANENKDGSPPPFRATLPRSSDGSSPDPGCPTDDCWSDETPRATSTSTSRSPPLTSRFASTFTSRSLPATPGLTLRPTSPSPIRLPRSSDGSPPEDGCCAGFVLSRTDASESLSSAGS